MAGDKYTIWGLDLRKIHPRAFKTMWVPHRHLRRWRFVTYQASMILVVIAGAVGTWVFSKYLDFQNAVQDVAPEAFVHINSIVGAGAYEIVAEISVATVFGAAFFFELFYPDYRFPRNIRVAWKASAVFVVFMWLAACILSAVIVGQGYARITGVDDARAAALTAAYLTGAPPKYSHFAGAVAWTVMTWIGLVPTVGSCVILFYADAWNATHPGGTRDRYEVSGMPPAVANAGLPPSAKPKQIVVV